MWKKLIKIFASVIKEYSSLSIKVLLYVVSAARVDDIDRYKWNDHYIGHIINGV
jgi:hypothetical protein